MTMSEFWTEKPQRILLAKREWPVASQNKFSKNNKTHTNPAATKIVRLTANPFIVEIEHKGICTVRAQKGKRCKKDHTLPSL